MTQTAKLSSGLNQASSGLIVNESLYNLHVTDQYIRRGGSLTGVFSEQVHVRPSLKLKHTYLDILSIVLISRYPPQ